MRRHQGKIQAFGEGLPFRLPAPASKLTPGLEVRIAVAGRRTSPHKVLPLASYLSRCRSTLPSGWGNSMTIFDPLAAE